MSKSKSILHIKNMVCPRCKMAVEGVLNDLNIDFSRVELGEVHLTENIPNDVADQLRDKLETLGFELLQSEQSALIAQIKSLIIEQIHHNNEPLKVNFSTYLSEKTKQSYPTLSRLFSTVEGITIEKFITNQKIEKVKEYLIYDEMSLSEIAFDLNYSSTAYLSAQFKKETGMTPSSFKKMPRYSRKNLDSI